MDQIALLGFLLGILVYRLSLVLWRVVSDRCFKIYSCLSTGDKLEWQGKCPSTIHAVALTAAVAYLFLAPDSPFDEAKVRRATPPHSQKIMQFCAECLAEIL